MDLSMQKAAVEQGLARWAKARRCKRRKLTANCAREVGVHVVALERSSFEPSYYLRFGIQLGDSGGFVQEPDCDIRMAVKGPWGRHPAVRLQDAPTADDVVALLTSYVDPLLAKLSTRDALDAQWEAGDLAGALILMDAKRQLGWE